MFVTPLKDYKNSELIEQILKMLKDENLPKDGFRKTMSVIKELPNGVLEVAFHGFEVGGSYCYDWESIYPPKYAAAISESFGETVKYVTRTSGGFGFDNYIFHVTPKSEKELRKWINTAYLRDSGLTEKDAKNAPLLKSRIDPKGRQEAFAYQISEAYGVSIALLHAFADNEMIILEDGTEIMRKGMELFVNSNKAVSIIGGNNTHHHYKGHNTDWCRTSFNRVIELYITDEELINLYLSVAKLKAARYLSNAGFKLMNIYLRPTRTTGLRLQIEYVHPSKLVNLIENIVDPQYRYDSRGMELVNYSRYNYRWYSDTSLEIPTEKFEERLKTRLEKTAQVISENTTIEFEDFENYKIADNVVKNGKMIYSQDDKKYETADFDFQVHQIEIRDIMYRTLEDRKKELELEAKYFKRKHAGLTSINLPGADIPIFIKMHSNEAKRLEDLRIRVSSFESNVERIKQEFEAKLKSLENEKDKNIKTIETLESSRVLVTE